MQTAATPNDSTVIVQITDTHLLADPDERLGGWHTQAALEAVLSHIRSHQGRLDGLLVTGDLVHDETAAGYRRLAAMLTAFDVPVWAIPGNHDDPALMPETLAGIQVGGRARVGGWHIHLLDSHVPGSDGGRLGDAQLGQLAAALTDESAPCLIAVHHQAAAVGSEWIDAIGLADGGELLSLLARHPQVRAVVCGHVHQASDQTIGDLRQWTTPATAKQFLPASRRHAEDTEAAPGYRVIHLDADGGSRSRVVRVPAARRAGRG